MKLPNILSMLNVSLIAFILVVLLLGTMFNVKVGPESFVEGATTRSPGSPGGLSSNQGPGQFSSSVSNCPNGYVYDEKIKKCKKAP